MTARIPLVFLLKEGRPISSSKKETKVNRRIRAPEVRVIGPDADQLGIVPITEALRLADEYGLDLVEVAPNAHPPVCKIIDHGKFKYEQKKKAQEKRRQQSNTTLKEVKLRPKTDTHDFDFKTNNARRFLENGHKVKCTVMFRGRELAHKEIGLEHLERIAERLEEVATLESRPRMEGRTMSIYLAPKS